MLTGGNFKGFWHSFSTPAMNTYKEENHLSPKKRIMKKIAILIVVMIGTIGIMSSCKPKAATPANDAAQVLSASDSAEMQEYKEFQQWKDMKAKEAAAPAPVRIIERQKTVVVEKQAPVATTTQKKGWSKAAKGTAIGAGVGAVAGAVINKRNRAAGAAIGAVLGGGGGYVIGRSKDKKDGRY